MSVKLTDFADTRTLQQLQKDFLAVTGMTAAFVDTDGNPLAQKHDFSDAAINYLKRKRPGSDNNSPLRASRCRWCSRTGAAGTSLP